MSQNMRHAAAYSGILALVILALFGCSGPTDPGVPPAYPGTWILTSPAFYSGQELLLGEAEFSLTAADDSWSVTGSVTGTQTRLNFEPSALTEGGVEQARQRLDIMMAAGEIPMFLADRTEYTTTYVADVDTMTITVVYDTNEWVYEMTK